MQVFKYSSSLAWRCLPDVTRYMCSTALYRPMHLYKPMHVAHASAACTTSRSRIACPQAMAVRMCGSEHYDRSQYIYASIMHYQHQPTRSYVTCQQPIKSLAAGYLHSSHKQQPITNAVTCHSCILRRFSQRSGDDGNKQETSTPQVKADEEKKPGIFQRFKMAYKMYGKVLIGVHVVTSSIWFAGFYGAAVTMDVVSILQTLGVSPAIIKPLTLPGVGNVAVMYLLYKMATPVRYAVTLGATQLTVRALEKRGLIKPPPKEDRIASLVKDKVGDMKDDMKDNIRERVDDMKDKRKELEQRMKDRVRDGRVQMKEKMIDGKDQMKERMKNKVSDVKEDVRDSIKDGLGKMREKYRSDRKDKER